jgi:signal transduction histidine kinase
MSLNRVDHARRSFSFRLNLWYTAFLTVAFCSLFAAAYLVLASQIRQKDKEIIAAKLEECRAWFVAGGLGLMKDRFLNSGDNSQNAFMLRVVGINGQIQYFSIPLGWEESDRQQFEAAVRQSDPRWLELPSKNRRNEWIFARTRLSESLLLEIGKSRENPEEVLAPFRIVFSSVMAGAVLIGFLGGAWLTQRSFRPVRQVMQTARGIIETGQMSARVITPRTGDELDELVSLFNRMLEKNEALIRGMREALDNVAHDLRTPMARLRGTAEMALQSASDNPEACREALADSMEESERVLTMLKTLMDVSEAETGTMRLNSEPFDASSLVRDVLDLYQIVAEEKQVSLQAQAPEGLVLEADRIRLQQVLANLVDNALKYTPAGGRVEVSASADATRLWLAVKDNGMGIPEEELPRIWERLYRGDKSRSQKGLGLGLCLVKAVVQAHGGQVEVSSRPNEGSVFTVQLPRGRVGVKPAA